MTIGSREDTYTVAARAPADVKVWPGLTRRISWGAVFAGVVMVLAVQILRLLGLGIGLGTVDLAQNGATPSAGSFGIGAGAWWGGAISSLL